MRWLALIITAALPPAQLQGNGNRPEDPNVLMRVCNGGCSAQLEGSFGQTITFTRASTWTCPNDDGTITQLASGVPCRPKSAGGTNYGARYRPAITNSVQFYNALATVPWATSAITCTAPTVTNNTADVTAPDGNSTATKLVYSSCTSASSVESDSQAWTATAANWIVSVYLRTLSGSSTVFLSATNGGTYIRSTCSVTSSWTKCTASGTLTAASWTWQIGGDTRDASQSAGIAAQTIYAWGAQAEATTGTVASDICPTAGAAATCAIETSTATAPAILTPSNAAFCWSGDVNARFTTAPAGETDLFGLGTYNAANSVNFAYDVSPQQWFLHATDNSATSKNWTPTCAVSDGPHHIRICYDGVNGATVAPLIYTDGVLCTTGAGTGTGTGIMSAIGAVDVGWIGFATTNLGGTFYNWCWGLCTPGTAGLANCAVCP